MSLIDELTISARAGNGGDGVVRWLHLKGQEYAGPSGGNGGNGGNVYIRGVRDINLLSRYRGEKKFEAQDGDAGGNRNKDGRGGNDFTIDLPVGSVVRNGVTGEVYELFEEGETFMVLKGGRGGAGNAVFKSSVNRSPTESTKGVEGESAELRIELRLIADAGFVGLPNAGKTSLLNALTGAEAKVGSYAFTTLDPNLGALYGRVLADIPGLIEGASDGKGLGFKFLRHIARTKLLVHCVSLEHTHGEEGSPFANYQKVREELDKFEGGVLAKKPEIVILTKSDTRDTKEIKDIIESFTAKGKKVTTVSILDEASLKVLSDTIIAALG